MKLLGFAIRLLFVVVPLALAGALVLVYTPEPLDDIGGRGGEKPVSPRLLERAGAAFDVGRSFECSEAELNRHIRSEVAAREADGFEVFAEFRGLWVRLGEGRLELVFEREVLGLDSTVSAEIQIVREGDSFRIDAPGGRFGRLPVPGGCLKLISGGLENIGAVLGPEKQMLSRTNRITISDGRLRLDPRAIP